MTARYVIRRLLQLLPVLVGMAVIVFLMIHLVPGDPARTLLGPRAPEEAVLRLRERWGLDEPLLMQFMDFAQRLLRGDLGESFNYGVPASQLIVARLPATLMLMGFSAVLASLITVPLAVLAALSVNRLPDHLVRGVPLIGLGMPSFWLGIVLLLVLALRTGWFPVGGYGETLTQQLRAMFLPGLTVAISIAPFTIRSLRASLIEVLDSDYIATAKAKGLPYSRVYVRHGLRNAVLPTVVVLGVNIGWLVGNTLIVEKVFAIPGVGALMIDAVLGRDFAIVQALALIFGTMVVLVNLTTDLLRAFLDPRVELS